ncbi:hypothetical protein PWG71_15755 [Nocardiopsis sp. N85]|uniref:hypothetical protein n=1 Tax=Nocardiopsis sp. N85 TaxID=3029400 RepID=UPI00237F5483|nr:hypothetical protein [Nocardiopsis sp. N85]MDE3722844.1 hypothetical protein [Nocardiopsis sp. N85]
MEGIGFVPAIWVLEALRKGLFPNTRAHTAAAIIADAADLDGRWCFLRLRTLAARSGGTLSESTAKRALKDLVAAGLVRKLSREERHAFFAADLASGRFRADLLPDVLELLIPADAFKGPVLEEINEVRARLGEEPLTPQSRPEPTTGHIDPSREVKMTCGEGSTWPEDPFSSDPCPEDPSPTSVRGRETPGRAAVAPPWALALLARIPDGALRFPVRDRAALARRLVALRATGVTEDELTRVLTGWEDTVRPFAALRERLASPETVRAWNDHALGTVFEGDAFSRRPTFVLDSTGRAADTCPEHPSVRNVPGGACALCGGVCRSEPNEIVHPRRPSAGVLVGTFGGTSVDDPFTRPKCEDERCNADRTSPRYRTVLRLDPTGAGVIAVPCPTCGHRTASEAAA